MANNSSTLAANRAPDSSGIDSDVWIDRDPDELIAEGYGEFVRTGPSQAQNLQTTVPRVDELDLDSPFGSTLFHNHMVNVLQIPATPSERSNETSPLILQEWEGSVVELNDDDFVAHLIDLTRDPDVNVYEVEEEAVIPYVELSQDDRLQIQVGSILRWVIGYQLTPGGTRTRFSRIVLRDLPVVTEQDLVRGKEWAEQIARKLRPE